MGSNPTATPKLATSHFHFADRRKCASGGHISHEARWTTRPPGNPFTTTKTIETYIRNTQNLIALASQVTAARQKVSEADSKIAPVIAVLEKLADSGLGHDNKVIRQTRRHALQSIHSAKVRLHERRRKFVQALDDAADDFNRRHLSKESLQRLCRRIGFEYDNSLTQRRREQYIDETRFAWWRAGWEAQGHACDFSELLVFKCPELGLEIGLRDYGAKPSATANITRGHTLLEIRCTSREEPQTVSVYTPCPRGLDGRPRTIADYARILDSNRVPACARESIHVLTEQDPEERARNLAVEIKYIETCRALSQLLPICPRFGKKGEWYGEAWNRELDNLASAIRDEQPLSLVRLRYKHGDEENRVVSQPAAGEAYGAASLTRLAEFRWNIDVESPADRATDLA